MKKLHVLPFLAALILVLCCILPTKAEAAKSGYYTYSVSGGKATITDCSTSISGNITIPSTLGGYPVTSIGSSAFSNCSSLTSITIPNSVTSIGNSAFYYCSSLTSITIPDSVTSIGGGTFSHCSSLTSITIPDSVTSIGSSAFSHCSSLTSITIPEGVTSIGDSAFWNCSSLQNIAIPSSVISIGYEAFGYCSMLTNITVHADNAYYVLEEGVLFNKDKTSLVYYPAGKIGETYKIPESVTSINDMAFDWCSSLTSITIPEGITSIGDAVFAHCVNLTTVEFNAINCTYTGYGEENTFSQCKNLTTINIGNKVKNIPRHAFSGAENLTHITIPNNVTSIGDYAFSGCSSLTSITIPDSVTSIGSWVFGWCSSLTSITISDSVTSIGDGAFWGCSSLQHIAIPSSVTSIGNSAFRDCSSLTSITIPDSVTSIGGGMFYGCSSLTSIAIPDSVTSIGSSVFSGCSSLTSINIPDSVTSIGNSAFYNCRSLTDVYYTGTQAQWDAISIGGDNDPLKNAKLHTKEQPVASGTCGENLTWELSKEGILTISGTGAMKNYTYSSSAPWYSKRSSIKKVVIEDGVTSIGNYAFRGCSRLTSITIPDSVTSIGSYAFDGCNSLTGITIPDSVTSIGDNAFAWCSSLTSITIPDGVTSIGDSAFSYCSSLTSITIPDSVTSIGSFAFRGCRSLTSITIPDSVTSIGNYAFYNCSSLTSITVRADNAHYASEGGVLFNKGKTLLVCYPSGKAEGSYKIPDSVTSIGNYAFYYCSSLTSITIPDSVTSIGSYAFDNCSSLTYHTYDNAKYLGNEQNPHMVLVSSTSKSITSCEIYAKTKIIASFAFSGCSSLTSITIPDSVASIGELAFSGCNGLNYNIYNGAKYLGNDENLYVVLISGVYSSKIHENTKLIGRQAFYGCGDLVEVTIPNSVTHIDAYAFGNCSNLASLNIGSGVMEIGDYAFQNCKSLTNVTIPGNVKNIGEYAFYNCGNMTSVALQEGVEGIGRAAFVSCKKLEHIILPKTLISVEGSAFSSTKLTQVCYGGTAEQRKALSIENPNSYLKNAKWNYNEAAVEAVIRENCETVNCICNGCKLTIWSKTKDPATHNWEAATCGTPDQCTLCGITKGEALGHNYEITTTPPTCTEKGYTSTICTVCGDTIISDYVDATGHSGDLWFELLPATCTEDGIEARICDVCKSTETRVLIATHHYQSAVTAPNCTEKGFTTYTCTVCGDSYISDYVDATGHSFGAWTQILAPSCVTEGEETRVCVSCGESERRAVPIVPHSYSCVVTAPTCTEQGFTTNTCAVCGDSYISDYVDATGHSFSAWVQAIAPSCAVEGSEERTCACGDKESQTIPALGHDYSAEVTAPTCTEKGFTTKTCSACGDVAVTDYVDAKGHGWSAWVEIKASTCTVEGTQVRFCNCGVRENAPTQKKPHSYDKEVCTACGDVAQYDWVLTENTAVNRTLAQDLYVDLNGFDLSGTIVTNGFKVYGMDSTTDGYTCDNIGYFTCVDENGDFIVPERIYTAGEKQYMAICEEDRYSFHRFFVGVTHMSLEPEAVGLGYKSAIYGDEMVFAELAETKTFTFCVQLEGYNPVYRRFNRNELTSGAPIALRIRNYDVENYSEHNLYARVSLTLKDGTTIETAQVALTFRWLAEQVNKNYADYTKAQLTSFRELLQKFSVVEKWDLVQIMGGVAEINGIQYASLEEAAAAVKGNEVIVLQKSTAVSFVQLPNGAALNLNGYTVSGTVLGTLVMNGGDLITAEGYKMIGVNADYYKTEDAVIDMTATEIEIVSGTVTLAQSWWTAAGQTLTIGEEATFVIPEGMNLNVNGSAVIVEGTAVVDGSVTLYSKDATVQAVEGLNVVAIKEYSVIYADGIYSVVA